MELIFLYHLLVPEGCHEDIFQCFKLCKMKDTLGALCDAATESSFSLALFMCLSFIFNKHNHAVHPLSAYLANLLTMNLCAPSGVSSIFIDIHQISRSSDVACWLFFPAALVADELNCLSDVISSCQKAYLTQKSILYSESMKSHNTVTPAANSIVIYSCLLRANYLSITHFLRLYLGAFPRNG